MAMENYVPNNFLSKFVENIDVFDCRLLGVLSSGLFSMQDIYEDHSFKEDKPLHYRITNYCITN